MTKDEIKQSVSMEDVARSYGLIPNRAGYIQCPFHTGDKHGSLKLYKDNFHCYGCGEDGDIFRFKMLMDGCSFREAFESLGGTYEHEQTGHGRQRTARRKMREYHCKKAAEQKARKESEWNAIYWRNTDILHIFRELMKEYPPQSKDWWYCLRVYAMAVCKDDMIAEEGKRYGFKISANAHR